MKFGYFYLTTTIFIISCQQDCPNNSRCTNTDRDEPDTEIYDSGAIILNEKQLFELKSRVKSGDIDALRQLINYYETNNLTNGEFKIAYKNAHRLGFELGDPSISKDYLTIFASEMSCADIMNVLNMLKEKDLDRYNSVYSSLNISSRCP